MTQPVSRHRRNCRTTGQHHAKRFGHAGHCACRSHHPACSGGWHQLAFNFINLDIIDATTTIITPEPAAIGTGTNALITNGSRQHRTGNKLNGWHIGTGRRHQLGRHGFVAATNQHTSIHWQGTDHFFSIHCHQIAEIHAGWKSEGLMQ